MGHLRTSALGVALLLTTVTAAAQEAPPPSEAEPSDETKAPEEPPDGPRAKARAAFLEGAALARTAQWAQALSAFERAETIKPHPVTTYNIGTCLRAIGAYTRALVTFRRALRESAAAGADVLPELLVNQAKTFIAEIDQLLVRVELSVAPVGVRLAVDGRPLQPLGSEHYGDLRPAGEGQPLSAATTTLVLNPGTHVFTFSRPGFEPAVLNETFSPGARRPLQIQLDRLPARLHIDASVPEALVTFGGRDLGPTPLDIARPAGTYPLLIEKEGYEPYSSSVEVGPGQQLQIEAPLRPATTSVFETWWFWTAAAAVVAGGVTVTYFATRPDPEPPPYDGGTTGWVIQSFAF